MLRKLRQMALIQTRVIQKEERRLALQSGVRLGHRPALHLLVFSKAHAQQLCCCQVIKGGGGGEGQEETHGVLLVAVAILFLPFLSLGPGCACRMN